MAVEGHQPQHLRSFRVLRVVFDTAALREDDFVSGLAGLPGEPKILVAVEVIPGNFRQTCPVV